MMKKIAATIVTLGLSMLILSACSNQAETVSKVPEPKPEAESAPAVTPIVNTSENTPTPSITPVVTITPPLSRALERITKKPFGIKVSPNNSPTIPEHFTGYHTGVDFEIFEDELNKDVPVAAICSGKILEKRTAQGYGGLLVQSCTIQNQPVTVVYGHLRLSSISHTVGATLNAGTEVGLLGDNFSAETDNERKHFHLGIHKGTAVNILGYVQNPAELSSWLDAEKILKAM